MSQQTENSGGRSNQRGARGVSAADDGGRCLTIASRQESIDAFTKRISTPSKCG